VGWVTYTTEDAAQYALKELNGYRMKNFELMLIPHKGRQLEVFLIHSFTHSLIHSFTHSLTLSLSFSLILDKDFHSFHAFDVNLSTIPLL
jgi:hypothetical protein